MIGDLSFAMPSVEGRLGGVGLFNHRLTNKSCNDDFFGLNLALLCACGSALMRSPVFDELNSGFLVS
jgi:hypothetical protein